MQPTMEIDRDGNKIWTLDGKYHREDGPAAEWADGDNYWWLNDRIHRVDGPAIEEANGHKEWWWNGTKFNFAEWLNENTELTEEEKVMFKLRYG
jgi:hypothetical protein